MYRTHTCGELRIDHINQEVTLTGWVQRIRELGGMTFITLRDRYGITQLVFDEHTPQTVNDMLAELGREFIIRVTGPVQERSSKNPSMPTGEIEVAPEKMEIVNRSEVPPFTIENETDGGEELRMKYRYLDLRREPLRDNMMLRHRMAQEIRKYLDGVSFMEVETPFLIKSTPE